MNINKLPDDCILYIFYFFNKFETLINCSRVCERWEHLVLERLHNVKYLTDSCRTNAYPVSTIYFSENDRLDQLAVSEWLPKLKILEIYENLDANFILNLSVAGLQLTFFYEGLAEYSILNNPSIEMISASDCYDFFANDIQGPILKQLFIQSTNVSKFARYSKYFPNLRRLHIDNYTCYPHDDTLYTGHFLEKLEILEICLHAQDTPCRYYGFSLADHCPILKSAFHFIQTDEYFPVNSEIKNFFLEDLVLLFEERHDWSVIRRILGKYPNLRHLRIRGPFHLDISDDNIPEILTLFPHIALITIENCENLTENSAKYVDWYCKRHSRSISFYYKKRPKLSKKYPHLWTKKIHIGEGLDFMKYCFLMDYPHLPCLLDPIE